MTTARSTVGVAVLNGRIYAVGGRDGSACLNSVESYDPHTNKWTVNCPMLKRRGGEKLIGYTVYQQILILDFTVSIWLNPFPWLKEIASLFEIPGVCGYLIGFFCHLLLIIGYN